MLSTHTAFPIVPDALGACEKSFLHQLYHCIAQNGHQSDFGVQQLADSVPISRVQLNRKLSRLLGRSAQQLITDYRFHTARQLLCETDVPVKEIAAKCGFRRHEAFCRSFTAAFQYSPSHFRNASRTSHDRTSLRRTVPRPEETMMALRQLVFEKAWLHDLLKMVLVHISDQVLSMRQLAAAAGMSTGTLNRRVRELFHVTPQRLIRDIRLQYACELLTTSRKTITETAYQAGFFDPAHFCRCFKQAMGCAPSGYRSLSTALPVHQLKEQLMNQNGK